MQICGGASWAKIMFILAATKTSKDERGGEGETGTERKEKVRGREGKLSVESRWCGRGKKGERGEACVKWRRTREKFADEGRATSTEE